MIKACYIRMVGFFTGDKMTKKAGDKMIEETESKTAEKKETPQMFINTGKANIFTEKGRVMPGASVALLPSVAKLYINLKRKQATK